MAFDDGTKFHERIGTVFGELVSDADGNPDRGWLGSISDWFPTYLWQLVVAPLFVVSGFFLVIFLMRQLPTVRLKGWVILATGLLAAAAAIDFVEGMDLDFEDSIADFFNTSTRRMVHFSKSLEEFIEMLGTTIFLLVFLQTLSGMASSITFRLNSGNGAREE